MNTSESILPGLRLPRPTLTAWVLSALAHVTLLAGTGALPFSTAQPGAFREMEVTLTMSGAAPAAKHSRAPAAVMTTAASTHTPIASSVAENTGGEQRDEPLVESRYDVAALNNPKPPYPLAARRQGAEGRVVLRAQVSDFLPPRSDTQQRGARRRPLTHAAIRRATLRRILMDTSRC
ncbi:MAG: hypothetical protein H6R47_1314 [Proteobacteria bacterium]|nr:hypothetical protein [Pseudomonadota bacterium]